MFLLYNLLLSFTFPIWVPWMWLRARRRGAMPDWSQRMGNLTAVPKKGDRPRVWFHAVSVGEVVASLPILRSLREKAPQAEIVLSVTTTSGHQTATDQAKGLFDHLIYFPIDVARFQLSAAQRVRPDVVAIMETELWMNFLWAVKVFDARTLLINGRISDRSFPRARALRPFYATLLAQLDQCLMQTPTDAERIRALGARDATVMGNAKFDQAGESQGADLAHWRTELGVDPARPVIVIGSSRFEEEPFLAEALRGLGEDVQIIHAPRHLERIPAIEAAQAALGWNPGLVRRSLGGRLGRYLLLDTYGELSAVYAVADLVVVGGGFADLGGQNILQPLAHGKPVLHGPHMQNFRDVAEAARVVGATQVCATPGELTAAIQGLLADRGRMTTMGEAARALIEANRGASERYAAAIAAALP